MDAWTKMWHLTFTYHIWDFPGSSDSKESAYNAGDLCLIPGSERSPKEGNGNPLQYSCLENSMDRGAWWATVHGVSKESDTTEQLTLRLSIHTHTHTQTKECYSASKKKERRKEILPFTTTLMNLEDIMLSKIIQPVFLTGECHGQRSLVGYIVPRISKSQTWLSD